MSNIFAETIARAISEYRQILRRHCTQAERVTKLIEMGLKDPTLYDSDVKLYKTAHLIIKDIKTNMSTNDKGYYAYSGISNFCKFLEEYLSKYEIENDAIIHCAQKASRALIKAIQLAMLPADRLGEGVTKDFKNCNSAIAEFGSQEQRELHLSNLERQQGVNPHFYTPILDHYEAQLSYRDGENANAQAA